MSVFFYGAGKHRYTQRLNRQPNNVLLQFKVYLEDICSQSITPQHQELKPLPADSAMAYEREKLIMQHMLSATVGLQMDDVYAFVYEFLQSKLSDFDLFDLLKGIEFYLPLLDAAWVHRTNERAQLDDGVYFIDYSVLGYQVKDTQND